jgi:hypothetical protein
MPLSLNSEPSGSVQMNALASSMDRLVNLIESAKIVDFWQLIALMQIALLVDWYGLRCYS